MLTNIVVALGVAFPLFLASGGLVQPNPAPATIRGVAWLEGTWVSATGQRVVEEQWTSPAGGVMLGVSRTLNGDRLVEFEFLRIVERDGGLAYVAQPNGNPPTDFRATHVDDHSITFENPQHDFPKIIRYELQPGGTLRASIGGASGQRERSWVFTRR